MYGRRTTRDCQTESRVNKTFWGFQKYKIQKSLQLNLRWGVSCTVLYCTVLTCTVCGPPHARSRASSSWTWWQVCSPLSSIQPLNQWVSVISLPHVYDHILSGHVAELSIWNKKSISATAKNAAYLLPQLSSRTFRRERERVNWKPAQKKGRMHYSCGRRIGGLSMKNI